MGDTTSTDTPSLVLVRYPNLSGALVLVTATEHGHHSSMAWCCSGCRAGNTGHSFPGLRETANDHAATCRALPQPKPATTPHEREDGPATESTLILATSAQTRIQAEMGEEERPVLNIDIGDLHVHLLSPDTDPEDVVHLAAALFEAAGDFLFLARQYRQFHPVAAADAA